MRFNKQRTTAHAIDDANRFPGIFRMPFGIGTEERDIGIAQRTRYPDRSELRIFDVGTTTRVRGLCDIDQRDQLAFPRINNSDLVGLISGCHEVTFAAVPTAIMEESGGADIGHCQIIDVAVVNEQNMPRFLNVDDEIRMLVRCDDGSNTWLRMVFLSVNGHATSRDDLQRLERVAVHDDVLRRPVSTGNGIHVFIAFVFRGLNRTRFEANLDLGNACRRVHPEVDHVDLGIATNREDETAGSGHTRNVYSVTSLQAHDDFLGVAINNGHFTTVTKRNREEIVDIAIVLWCAGTILGCNHDVPAGLHIGHTPFRRCRWFLLQEARHDVDFGFAHFARRSPVRHAGW